ncbi:putative integral membrane protein [Ophiocordyceps camponoti-floridani]|uniref:Putative integral membrane protein n=1 Tax=Ophiocordyceps camponoti-floridani TaxID=2030778 RepID=A0A8H4QB42_9HYPO|nr:putative integral membrane protein [Ophiocordyceps camponoti-floridani]
MGRLWILKYAILEFLKRLTDLTWRRSHLAALGMIRWTLVATFMAVVISILAECRPFSHYWQVLPDPGGQCRQGIAQLITMATCNIATDALLIIFPIPIILSSQMRLRRKLQLIMLFSLSISVVAVTIYRVPHILREHGRQQYRSLLASVELIFATASANALVLGSFVRDRGIKKAKFRSASLADSFDRSSYPRRPTLQQQWGSDEDLVRDLGLSLDPQLRRPSAATASRRSVASPRQGHDHDHDHDADDDKSAIRWELGRPTRPPHDSLSFLDVGGLLDDDHGRAVSSAPLPPASVPASGTGRRRGSSALLQDLGGLLGPRSSPLTISSPAPSPKTESPSPRAPRSYDSQRDDAGPVLMDPGGLLK